MQNPDLDWRADGVPVSRQFDDPYYSLQDGLAETRHTFLDGNDLSSRLCDGFHIAELGFGTGLNLCATLHLWRTLGCEGRLRYTSFEAYPLTAEAMDRALAAWPDLARERAELRAAYHAGAFRLGPVDVDIRVGLAQETLPNWQDFADAWFLDGFSPARNPDMWSAELMAEIGRHAAKNGSFATYTAAGHVRRALESAGFAVERRPGFGRKRHMTRGQFTQK